MKIISLAGVLVTLASFAIQTRDANAQTWGGRHECWDRAGNVSYGMMGSYGMGGDCNSGCNRTWTLGCRNRGKCGHQQFGSACCQFPYTGAACCMPLPNTCFGAQVDGTTVQPVNATPVPALNDPTPKVNHSPATATAPTPGS